MVTTPLIAILNPPTPIDHLAARVLSCAKAASTSLSARGRRRRRDSLPRGRRGCLIRGRRAERRRWEREQSARRGAATRGAVVRLVAERHDRVIMDTDS
eukprot:1567656-Pyramimonas_sp.AAC.1